MLMKSLGKKYAVLLNNSGSVSTAAFCDQGWDIDWVIDQYFTQDRVLHFHDGEGRQIPQWLQHAV